MLTKALKVRPWICHFEEGLEGPCICHFDECLEDPWICYFDEGLEGPWICYFDEGLEGSWVYHTFPHRQGPIYIFPTTLSAPS